MSCSFLENDFEAYFFGPEIFWLRTTFRELRILSYLCCEISSDLSKFSKTMTLNYFSFVYYSWKSLLLQNILKCAAGKTSSLINKDLCNKTTPNILRRKPINMLTSACKNEHLFSEHLLAAAS